jgi:hypothetical protein
MPLLNYTTTIAAHRSAGEIQAKLARAKAQAVMVEYDGNGQPVAMSFRIQTATGLLSFRLPARIDGALRALMKAKVDRRFRNRDHAARVAWRILSDWISVQLAVVECELASLPEVFLPYVQDGKGATLYDKLAASGFKQLMGPKGGD